MMSAMEHNVIFNKIMVGQVCRRFFVTDVEDTPYVIVCIISIL